MKRKAWVSYKVFICISVEPVFYPLILFFCVTGTQCNSENVFLYGWGVFHKDCKFQSTSIEMCNALVLINHLDKKYTS